MNVTRLIATLESKDFRVEHAEQETELIINCPLCYSEEKKLYISTDNGSWICFRCDARGGLRDLLLRVCEMTMNEAVPLEMSLVAGAKKRAGMARVRPSPASIIDLPKTFHLLGLDDIASPAAHYLEGRGIGLPQAMALGIGYCIFGYYQYRVIVPVMTQGALRTFVARSWLDKPAKKVLMPPGSQAERALFGYDNLENGRPLPEHIILVEGVFDAIGLWNAGYPATFATLGAHVTDLQRNLIKQLKPKSVTLLRDDDEAGQKAALKEGQALSEAMLTVKIAHLGGVDPGEATREDIISAVEEAVDIKEMSSLGTEALKEAQTNG